jgi:hypothetical protein
LAAACLSVACGGSPADTVRDTGDSKGVDAPLSSDTAILAERQDSGQPDGSAPQDQATVDTVEDSQSAEAAHEAGNEGTASSAGDDGPIGGDTAGSRFDASAGSLGSSCEDLPYYNNLQLDSSQAIQDCIGRTAAGATLALPAGRYRAKHSIVVPSPIYLGTRGKTESDPPCDVDNADEACFELVADSEFVTPSKAQAGLLWVAPAAAGTTLDHLVFNGNNAARLQSEGAAGCASQADNYYGYNVTVAADGIRLLNSVSRNALCGTGMEIDGKNQLTLSNNIFAYNGIHGLTGLWSDGLTVTDAVSSVITHNTLIDNTDVDFILGGCVDCTIQDNRVSHSDRYEASSYVAMMLTVWLAPASPTSSGDFTGADIAYNEIDCGSGKRCGFGFDVGIDFCCTPGGPLHGGAVHDNTIRNAQQGFNVSHTTDVMHIYNNLVTDSGGNFITACGQMSLGNYNISANSVVDLTGDSVPASSYSHETWTTGCMPNP